MLQNPVLITSLVSTVF